MTKQQAVNKLVSWALSQVGYSEGANNWNKYAPKWTEAGGWNVQNQPWCDVFVDVCFIECFGLDAASELTYQPKGSFSALCRESARFYREAGAWRDRPEPGDQIFFYSGGAINHTGIVEKVVNGAVYTVEGNSSDGVRRGVYSTASSYIAGYGRPNWSIFSSNDTESVTTGENTTPSAPSEAEGKTCVVMAKPPILYRGDNGSWVIVLQARLLAFGQKLPKWGTDGDFGAETQGALERFQKGAGLTVNSKADEPTWAKLLGE